jgi:multiple sugar transport system permease protein
MAVRISVGRTLSRFLGLLATAVFTVICLFPVFWMVSTSLKPTIEIFAVPPHWLPLKPTLSGYITILSTFRYLKYFFNSYFISLMVTLISLIIGTLAAYGFSRTEIKGKKVLLFATLILQMFPGVVLIIPYFNLAQRLGIYNTYTALIVANCSFVLPFSIWMLHSYLESIPVDLEDAARIDGCTRLGAIGRVTVPLMVPSYVAIGTWQFLWAWNEYMFAVTLTTGWEKAPITVGMGEFFGEFGRNWNSIMAVGVLGCIPLLIVFLFLQKFLIQGMTAGAVK